MNPIQHLAGQTLYWTQAPLFKMDYLLQDAERVQTLATLQWESSLAMRAMAKIGTQPFSLDRPGWLGRRIEIRTDTTQAGELIATFKHGWTSYNGTLRFETGQHFEWKNTHHWHSHWIWTTTGGGELMKFMPDTQIRRLTRSESRIELYPPAADFPEIALLAVLGWYMMLSAAGI
jgi:hypothetical protein